MLRRQRREGLRAGAAGSNALGRHGEEGASIKILPARKKKNRQGSDFTDEREAAG